MLSFRQLASLVCNARPSASSFLSHSGGSKLASLVCSQVQPAASPSFLLRFSDTSAYGLGACVAFSLVGQTRFARLQCSAFGLELSITKWREQTRFARLHSGSACGLTFVSASLPSH